MSGVVVAPGPVKTPLTVWDVVQAHAWLVGFFIGAWLLLVACYCISEWLVERERREFWARITRESEARRG